VVPKSLYMSKCHFLTCAPPPTRQLEYDNGERFDLRLPYADQGYVDEDADVMGKLFGKRKAKAEVPEEDEEAKTKKGPFGLW